jgi:hypothetical protein
MAQQTGAADGQTKEIVQEVSRLTQGNSEVGAAVAGEQAGAGPDVGAGQFQVAASLAGMLTGAATVAVAALAMPFQLGFGKVGNDVVVKLARGFEIIAATMRAVLGMDVVLDERGLGRRLRAEDAGMRAMLLAPAVVSGTLAWLTFALRPFAALEELLELMLQMRDPPAQLGVLGFEFGNP